MMTANSNAEHWLLTGGSGQLGGYVVRSLEHDTSCVGLHLVLRRELPEWTGCTTLVDLEDETSLQKAVTGACPTHILHLGGMTSVADAWRQPEHAERVNVNATRTLASAAADVGARLVFSSTDMVFDGRSAPYAEDARRAPLSAYGRSKAAAEDTLTGRPETLIVRLPLMYGWPIFNRTTTFTRQIYSLRAGTTMNLFTDEFRTPVWLPDAARALVALARSDLEGVVHVAGPERLSRFEMVERFAAALQIAHPRLAGVSRDSIDAPEPRACDLSLNGSQFAQLFPGLLPRPVGAHVFTQRA